MCDELSLFAKLHKYLHLFSSIIHHFPLALIPTTTATTPPPTTTPNKAKMEARQKVLSIKKSQETAQSLLPPNTLYIALCIRSDPPVPNDFHWALYLHTPAHTPGGGGTKHDAENHAGGSEGGWIAQHAPTAGILKTNFLCVLVHIADIPETQIGVVEGVMRERDGDLNEIPAVTCRVWLLVVLERLIGMGVVRCEGGVQGVERECLGFGNEFMEEAAGNVQPRPVVRAGGCFE